MIKKALLLTAVLTLGFAGFAVNEASADGYGCGYGDLYYGGFYRRGRIDQLPSYFAHNTTS